jgi:hypothetical protein
LLLVGGLIPGDLGLVGGEIAEAGRIISVAGFVDIVQVELACM